LIFCLTLWEHYSWVEYLGYYLNDYGVLCPSQNVVSEFLFPNLTGDKFGSQMNQANVRKILAGLFDKMNRHLVESGFPPNEKLTPHSLRHTFAIMCLDNGVKLPAIQAMLGHRSLETTGLYLTLNKEDYRKEAEKFNPIINLDIEELKKDLAFRG
jgi:site-specific recombinase XerD